MYLSGLIAVDGTIKLGDVRHLVLDEVDRMLDIGFRDDIRNILSRVKGIRSQDGDAPQAEGDEQSRHAQTIFVSATISDEIEKLARRYMREPVEKLIAPGANDRPTVELVEQYYFPVQPWDKYRLLRMLLERENPELAIVFCRTKRGSDKVHRKLSAKTKSVDVIHGDLQQSARDRVMKAFRAGFIGKCSPVHFFWGGFDLAVTRFSGRAAPPRSARR